MAPQVSNGVVVTLVCGSDAGEPRHHYLLPGRKTIGELLVDVIKTPPPAAVGSVESGHCYLALHDSGHALAANTTLHDAALDFGKRNRLVLALVAPHDADVSRRRGPSLVITNDCAHPQSSIDVGPAKKFIYYDPKFPAKQQHVARVRIVDAANTREIDLFKSNSVGRTLRVDAREFVPQSPLVARCRDALNVATAALVASAAAKGAAEAAAAAVLRFAVGPRAVDCAVNTNAVAMVEQASNTISTVAIDRETNTDDFLGDMDESSTSYISDGNDPAGAPDGARHRVTPSKGRHRSASRTARRQKATSVDQRYQGLAKPRQPTAAQIQAAITQACWHAGDSATLQ